MGGNGYPERLFYGWPITELQTALNFLGPSCVIGKVTRLACSALHWPVLGR